MNLWVWIIIGALAFDILWVAVFYLVTARRIREIEWTSIVRLRRMESEFKSQVQASAELLRSQAQDALAKPVKPGPPPDQDFWDHVPAEAQRNVRVRPRDQDFWDHVPGSDI